MNNFLSIGRWLFAIPFAIFGIFHFVAADAMAESIVPDYLPAKTVFVYITGAGLIAASIAMLIGKKDRLATILLACFLLLSALMVHAPGAMSGMQISVTMLMKDIALAGGALMFGLYAAEDKTLFGR